ncbi:MAG: hypothetical protein ACQESC_00990 [Nanobdellota archaeon]
MIFQKKAIVIIMIIVMVLISSTITGATTTTTTKKTIPYKGEHVEFGLLEENIRCNSTTEEVFRIERLNYTQGIEPLTIEYNYTLFNDNNSNYSTIIDKTINKYTQARTGKMVFDNTNAQHHIKIHFNTTTNATNDSLKWEFNNPCQQAINQTTEENEGNTSFQTNHTNNINNTTPTNTTQHNETENETIQGTIHTNKQLYNSGEQASITFNVSENPEEITYWIEDLQGNYEKTPYSTTNTNEKHHTFSSPEHPEKIFRVCANFTFPEQNKYSQTYVFLVQETQDNTQEKESEQEETTTTIEITDIDTATTPFNTQLTTQLDIIKGSTRKQTITISFETTEGKTLIPPSKLRLFTTESHIRTTQIINIPRSQENTAVMTIQGLDQEITTQIPLETKTQEQKDTPEQELDQPELVNTYTRQTYADKSLNWYVRVKPAGNTTVTVEWNNQTLQQHANTTTTLQFTLEDPTEEMTILTTARNRAGKVHKNDSIHLKLREQTSKETSIARTKQQANNTTLSPSILSNNESNEITGANVIETSKNKKTNTIKGVVVGIIVLGTILLLYRRRIQQKK